jgi:glucose-1-phosphate thymidylyltransferase
VLTYIVLLVFQVWWEGSAPRVEVENSVLMDRVELSDLGVRVFNSLIGSDAVVRGGEGRPRGLRLILGERSGVELRA